MSIFRQAYIVCKLRTWDVKDNERSVAQVPAASLVRKDNSVNNMDTAQLDLISANNTPIIGVCPVWWTHLPRLAWESPGWLLFGFVGGAYGFGFAAEAFNDMWLRRNIHVVVINASVMLLCVRAAYLVAEALRSECHVTSSTVESWRGILFRSHHTMRIANISRVAVTGIFAGTASVSFHGADETISFGRIPNYRAVEATVSQLQEQRRSSNSPGQR